MFRVTCYMIQNMEQTFHEKLKSKMDEFVHLTYALAKNFPKDELYGATSQLRRASLSVVLNYIEGYARKRKLVMTNFLETSYGSLKESKYLLEFSLKEGFVRADDKDYEKAITLAGEIGAMLWKTLEKLEKS